MKWNVSIQLPVITANSEQEAYDKANKLLKRGRFDLEAIEILNPRCPICHNTNIAKLHSMESGDLYKCRRCSHSWWT